MRTEKIELAGQPASVYLETIAAEHFRDGPRPALLILPGGAYEHLSDREGEPVALAFLPYGINCFILHYSVGKGALFPAPLIQAGLAVAWIREHAEEYGVDPHRVFVTGFSAGGHLCAALGTLWHLPELTDGTGLSGEDIRPDGILPVYPVISTRPDLCSDTQWRCFENITGIRHPDHSRNSWSLELCVDDRTPPAFLVHTANDQAVYAGNSLVFAQALASHGISYELHIYADGPHGMALSNEVTSNGDPKMQDPHKATWVSLAAEWIRSTSTALNS